MDNSNKDWRNKYSLTGDVPTIGNDVRVSTTPFVMGPIPLRWLEESSKAPGGCSKVAIFLCYYYGLNKKQAFQVSKKKLIAHSGLSESAVSRAIQCLAERGLITVRSRNGQRNEFDLNFRQDGTN